MTADDVGPQRHWDSMYEDPRATVPWEGRTIPPEIRCWGSLVPAGARVLDLGCGRGAHALALARDGRRTVGIDLSANAIETARRRAAERGEESVTFRTADVCTFRSATHLDLVYDYSLLHHVPDHDPAAYVATVDAALRPGGLYCLVCYSDRDPDAQGQRRRRGNYGNLIYHRSRQEITELFSSVSMTAVEYHGTAVGPAGKHQGHHFVFRKHR